MHAHILLPALGMLQLASAHFSIEYPFWRGDSFELPGASQWVWPCANVSQETSANNRTAWPLTGGSLSIHGHHPWALTYINLGVGNVWTGSVNKTLVSNFNQTGNGTFCIKELGKDVLGTLGVKEGDNATLQVIQIATSGAALYNCADITFSSTAQTLNNEECFNSTGVGGVAITNVGSATSSGGNASSTGSGAASTTTAPNAAGQIVVPAAGSLLAAGLAAAVAFVL